MGSTEDPVSIPRLDLGPGFPRISSFQEERFHYVDHKSLTLFSPEDLLIQGWELWIDGLPDPNTSRWTQAAS